MKARHDQIVAFLDFTAIKFDLLSVAERSGVEETNNYIVEELRRMMVRFSSGLQKATNRGGLPAVIESMNVLF